MATNPVPTLDTRRLAADWRDGVALYPDYLRAAYPVAAADDHTGQPPRRAGHGAERMADPNRHTDPATDVGAVRDPDADTVDWGCDITGDCRSAQSDAHENASADVHGDGNYRAMQHGDGDGFCYGLPGHLLVGPDDVRGM